MIIISSVVLVRIVFLILVGVLVFCTQKVNNFSICGRGLSGFGYFTPFCLLS